MGEQMPGNDLAIPGSDDDNEEAEKQSMGSMFGSEFDDNEESDEELETAKGGFMIGEEQEEAEEEEEEESVYFSDRDLIKTFKSKMKIGENELQKDVRRIMTRHLQEYIVTFIDKNETADVGSGKRQQIFDKLYRKLYNLNAVVFFEDKEKYLELLRVGPKHEKALDLWDNVNKQYQYMNTLAETDEDLVKEFLDTWLNNDLVESNALFFLEYEYQVPNLIVLEALMVEEVTVVRKVVRKA